MPNKSLYKLLRDVKRMTRFTEEKRSKLFESLSIQIQYTIKFPPKTRTLSRCCWTSHLLEGRLNYQLQDIPANEHYQLFPTPSRQIPLLPCASASPPASRWIPPWAQLASSRHISPFSSLAQVRPRGRIEDVPISSHSNGKKIKNVILAIGKS